MPEGHAPNTADLPTIKIDVASEPPQAATASSRPLPQVIGGCRRIRLLGAGGMGEVHLAEHLRLDRKVALKILRPATGSDPGFVQRFLRESKAMAAVSHPNVVAIHDAGEQDGLLFMAIEYVDGNDLKKLIRTCGTLDEATTIGIMIACCRGLEAIHAAGLVHRDIKPANIFLDRRREPKIGDLGLARHTDGEDRMTLTGVAWGTPAYMPPEQLRGIADLDIRCDIYALGATMYIALTGSEPFTGATAFVITNRILTEPAPDVRGANRQVGPAMAAIIRTCLEKDRQKRYPSPLELRVDLERARDGLPLAFAAMGPVVAEEPGPQATTAAAAPAGMVRRAAAEPAAPPRTAPPRISGNGGGGLDARTIRMLTMAALGVAAISLLWFLPGGGDSRRHAGPTVASTTQAGLVHAKPTREWMSREGTDARGRWCEVDLGSATLRLRRVPAGTFRMGSPPDEPGRDAWEGQHEVEISRPFWLSETVVTTGQYQALLAQPSAEITALARNLVNWYDAKGYASALAGRVQEDCHLPTEAQWEYASRAGATSAAISIPGEDALRTVRTVGVRINQYGLFDLPGPVREWCLDTWDGHSDYPSGNARDPIEVLGSSVVVRGGVMRRGSNEARHAQRTALDPQERREDVGFRVVIEER